MVWYLVKHRDSLTFHIRVFRMYELAILGYVKPPLSSRMTVSFPIYPTTDTDGETEPILSQRHVSCREFDSLSSHIYLCCSNSVRRG